MPATRGVHTAIRKIRAEETGDYKPSGYKAPEQGVSMVLPLTAEQNKWVTAVSDATDIPKVRVIQFIVEQAQQRPAEEYIQILERQVVESKLQEARRKKANIDEEVAELEGRLSHTQD